MIATNDARPSPQEEVLEQLGLSRNETKVYLTLLEMGITNVGKIAEKSKLYRPNIYDAIERLKRKGLVNYITKENKKHYQASHPEHLVNLIQQKEALLKNILPQLQLSHDLSNRRVDVRIFEGMPAIRSLKRNMVEKKQDIFSLGVPKESIQMNGSDFQEGLHNRRIANKVNHWHLYNSDVRERAKYTAQMPLTHSRVMEQNYPVNTKICGDEVIITMYAADPPISVAIKNEDIAKAYLNYFWILWEQAKEP